jgi:hypothetical protein
MNRVLAASALLITMGVSASAQRSITLEVSGGAGFTSVDVQKWGGASAMNEEQVTTAVDVRGFFLNAGGFQFGAEAGYRYLFYYEVPFGTTTLYRDVDATRIGAVARRQVGRFVSVDAGAAAYLFEDFTDLGLSGALVFMIPIGSRLSAPIHLRADAIFDDQLILAPAGTIGLSLKLR